MMVDCFNTPGLIPIEDAIQKLLSEVPAATRTEVVTLENAVGRVTSQDIRSTINVPAFNNSEMDGYAIRDDKLSTRDVNTRKQFTLIGSALAGKPFEVALNDGECIRIMTGAVVPDSANAVVMQENVDLEQHSIYLKQPASLSSHIRQAGEDIAKDQLIFTANHQLKTVDLGLLASLGIAKVNVYQKLKVAIMSTGDELKIPGQVLNLGDIYESNRHVISSMLAKLPIDIIDLGIIKDNKNAIFDAFIKANKLADVVISSGGVSVGEADHVKEILETLGDITFWKVAIKPGKPFAFGKLPDSLFFGLPGNPVSATVTLHQLAIPALEKMLNMPEKKSLALKAYCQKSISKRAGRAEYQRAIAITNEQGQLVVTPLPKQGSNILSSLTKANCYIVLARESLGCEKNEPVDILLFDHFLA